MRRFPTLIVTSIRWGKMGQGEGTQRFTQLRGFTKLTSPYIHKNIMRQEDCWLSRQMAQGAAMRVLLAPCGIHCIMGITNSTAFICYLLDVSYWTSWISNDMDRHKLDLSRALEDHHHDFLQLMLEGLNAPMLSNATKAVVITWFLTLCALLKLKYTKGLHQM